MTRVLCRRAVMVVAVLAVAVPLASAATPAQTVADPVVRAASDDSQDTRMRAELVELADAWALGGGTYGYPFWEKAGQRWQAGQISTTMYREYVDGYRDRLRAGCELLDVIDPNERVSDDVRSLVLHACEQRVDALQSQHRWLNAVIEQDYAARGEDVTSLQEQAVTHETAFREAIEESLRDARLAMNAAQAALQQAGLERLSEDAFI